MSCFFKIDRIDRIGENCVNQSVIDSSNAFLKPTLSEKDTVASELLLKPLTSAIDRNPCKRLKF